MIIDEFLSYFIKQFLNKQLGTLGKGRGNEALKENILNRVHRPLATEENKNAKTEVGAARLILEAEHFVSRVATIEFCCHLDLH